MVCGIHWHECLNMIVASIHIQTSERRPHWHSGLEYGSGHFVTFRHSDGHHDGCLYIDIWRPHLCRESYERDKNTMAVLLHRPDYQWAGIGLGSHLHAPGKTGCWELYPVLAVRSPGDLTARRTDVFIIIFRWLRAPARTGRHLRVSSVHAEGRKSFLNYPPTSKTKKTCK